MINRARTWLPMSASNDIHPALRKNARDEVAGAVVPCPARASHADLVLAARLRDGDELAFTELIDAYHGRLLRLARAFVASMAIAEEVVQDTWVGVLNGLDSFEGR